MAANLEIGFCTAQSKKWCKRIKREDGGFGGFLGVRGCYRTDDQIICVGTKCFFIDWNDTQKRGTSKGKAFDNLLETISHEIIHKAIFDVTHSRKACLTFDYLFIGLSNFWKENRDYFAIAR